MRKKYRCLWIAQALLVLGIGFTNSSQIAKAEPKVPEPHTIVVGGYLTSLYDLDSSKGTFSADLWIWSKTSNSTEFNLELLEINHLNSKFPHNSFGQRTYPLEGGLVYAVRKINATFLHNYNLKHFPFDRQRLNIHLENTEENSDVWKLIADTQSAFDKEILIDGWKIESYKMFTSNKGYGSNFGYLKDSPDVSYSRATIEINLKRDAPLIFFKVTLGLFAAVSLAILSTLLRTDNDNLFSARIGLLGGTLLAVVVNQQFADINIGESTAVTLIDSLHMLGSVSILGLFICTIVSRFLSKNIRKPNPQFFDNATLIIVTLVFCSLSGIWISKAVLS